MSSPVRPAGRSLADTRKALLALREKQQKSLRATSDTVTPVPRDRALPLSFAQQRLWFLDQWAPGQAVYNSPVALLLRTELDHTAFQGALTDLVARHEVLRTRYPVENGVPYQEIEPAPESVPLPVTDLTGASRTEVEDWVSAFAQQPFDLERGPVLRAALGKLSDREHVLVLNTHHIATDGASTGIVTTELVELYLSLIHRRCCPRCRCSTPTTRSGSAATSPARSWTSSWPTGASASPTCPPWTCPPTGLGR